jgi:SAM-dependent methyltransferase
MDRKMLTLDEAIRVLRDDPRHAEVVRDAYLESDAQASAERFYRSAEFSEALKLLGDAAHGSRVLDLGAGVGIASYAFIQAGSQRVYAIEPNLSREVGCGALKRLRGDLPIEIISAVGEDIPLPRESVDIIYTRQVLHHTRNLPRVLSECARSLRSSGVFLACREHVVDNERQLQTFLNNHPIHQLAGGEHAYRLEEYLSAITASGLQLKRVIGPWDSVINAYPGVRTQEQLERFPRALLRQKLGIVGLLLSYAPGAQALVWRRVKRPMPGRMYSFLAVKL